MTPPELQALLALHGWTQDAAERALAEAGRDEARTRETLEAARRRCREHCEALGDRDRTAFAAALAGEHARDGGSGTAWKAWGRDQRDALVAAEAWADDRWQTAQARTSEQRTELARAVMRRRVVERLCEARAAQRKVERRRGEEQAADDASARR